MAIGLGRMFGFRFPENFIYPYISRSIQEFWQRWHVSLSSWFKDYLYIALGGNRRGLTRANINIVLVFLLCGLWHGASWNFVMFGAIQGFFLVLESRFLGKWLQASPKWVGNIYTNLIVFFSFTYFRGADMPEAHAYMRAMIAFDSWTPLPYDLLTPSRCFVFVVAFFASKGWAAKAFLSVHQNMQNQLGVWPYLWRGCITCWILFFSLVSVAYLFNGASNPFIYFRF